MIRGVCLWQETTKLVVLAWLVGLVIALRSQTSKHTCIRVGWSHYTDTSEPVHGYEAQNMATVQSDFSITGPRAYQMLLPGPHSEIVPQWATTRKQNKIELIV
jgi:hypothetical protein